MKRKSTILTTIMMTALLLLMAVVPVLAGTATIDTAKKGDLSIIYRDNDDEGDDPVADAEFDIYKVADIGPSGEYISIIPEFGFEGSDKTLIIDEYTEPDKYVHFVEAYYSKTQQGLYMCHTNANGEAKVRSLPVGLYLVKEINPAKEHLATKPFLVSMPHMEYDAGKNYGWTYDITCYPKSQPCGDLVINKTVQGNAGETDREFHFNIVFSLDKMAFHYTTSDGREGTIASGQTIALKHNQSAKIDTVPIGTQYTVTETEANQENYVTTFTGNTGRIMKKTVGKASFINKREQEVTPTPTPNGGGSNSSQRIQTSDRLPWMAAGLLAIVLACIVGVISKRKQKRQ